MKSLIKLIRVTTPSATFKFLLKGQSRFLSNFFNVIAVTGDDVFLDDIKKNEEIECHVVPMKRNISLINDFISLINLYLFFRKEKPTIVHSVTPKAGLLSMIAAYFASVPIRIHSFTGLIFPTKRGLKKYIIMTTDKILCYFSTNLYSDGNGVKRDLLNYNITKKEIKVLANGSIDGLDCNYFNKKSIQKKTKSIIKKKYSISDDNFVFIFVGRLVKDKGINELILAFNDLTKKNNKLKLLLVGDFENNLDPLNNLTNEIININKSIILTGVVDDVRPYFAISNVFVFPTYREGFPVSLMEAGAMNLPSIVTNVNGCNEIIKDNFNGLVIPPKEKQVLRDKMFEIYSNNNLYNLLSNNSRKAIVDKYNQKKVRNLINIEYNNLLSSVKTN
jgi:glycosyltransferase involved in cell wall biosynthesis